MNFIAAPFHDASPARPPASGLPWKTRDEAGRSFRRRIGTV
jgi:hypothetical protein